MLTYIALFRGINVGGKNILPMDDLTRELKALGLKNIQTYIQSGNVVFQTPKKPSDSLGEEIADRIESKKKFRPHVLILDHKAFEHAMQLNPFREGEADPKTLHLMFLADKPKTPDMKAISELKSATENFQLREKIFYLHAPDGIGRSKLAASVEKILAVSATGRNWRTVVKLSELAAE